MRKVNYFVRSCLNENEKVSIVCVLSSYGNGGVMAGSSALNVSADNPICQTAFTPDPAPVVFGDRLYVYTGRDRDGNNDFYYMNGYQVMSTTDMQNWTNHGAFIQDGDIKWGKKDSYWASQCIERNGPKTTKRELRPRNFARPGRSR